MLSPSRHPLAIIVLAQLFGTSLWFSVNGVGLSLPGIWLTTALWASQGPWAIWWLLPGPVLGLWSLQRTPARGEETV